MQMRHLYFSTSLIIPRMWRWHSKFRGARGRNKVKIRQRNDADVWRQVFEKASVAMQLSLAEEPQWSDQTIIYDYFLDSSPDFHMLTEELSAILPGDPIPSISVIQAFTAHSNAKYFGMNEPGSAWTVQLLLCPVVILLTSMACFSFLLSVTFCIGWILIQAY